MSREATKSVAEVGMVYFKEFICGAYTIIVWNIFFKYFCESTSILPCSAPQVFTSKEHWLIK